MRRFWIAVAVWAAFWALYPTFGRPRVFSAAIRSGAKELEACNPIPDEKTRQACWQAAGARQERSFGAITLRGEYAGYAPVGLGVGVVLPLIVMLGWKMAGRRQAA